MLPSATHSTHWCIYVALMSPLLLMGFSLCTILKSSKTDPYHQGCSLCALDSYTRVHPTTFSPIYCQRLCSSFSCIILSDVVKALLQHCLENIHTSPTEHSFVWIPTPQLFSFQGVFDETPTKAFHLEPFYHLEIKCSLLTCFTLNRLCKLKLF